MGDVEKSVGASTDQKGNPSGKSSYSYRGGKLRELATYDAEGAVGLREDLNYDAEGHQSEENHYMEGTLLGKTVFKTDSRGNMSEAAFFLANGVKAIAPIGACYNAHRVSYSFDDQHRMTEETSCDLNGNVKKRTTYQYDDKGNVVEEHQTGNLSTIHYIHQYEYDTHGNWVKETVKQNTSREPLFNDQPDEFARTTIKTRKITYY